MIYRMGVDDMCEEDTPLFSDLYISRDLYSHPYPPPKSPGSRHIDQPFLYRPNMPEWEAHLQ